MSVVSTREAMQAIAEGRRVEGVDLTFRKTWLRRRTKTKPERHEVLVIEPAGHGYAVTFAGGRVRVVSVGATFWVERERKAWEA